MGMGYWVTYSKAFNTFIWGMNMRNYHLFWSPDFFQENSIDILTALDRDGFVLERAAPWTSTRIDQSRQSLGLRTSAARQNGKWNCNISDQTIIHGPPPVLGFHTSFSGGMNIWAPELDQMQQNLSTWSSGKAFHCQPAKWITDLGVIPMTL